jgi:hypothetical protein
VAYQLVAEVLDHAPVMTAAERLILVAIAEFARKDSRECSCAVEDLERRTGAGTTGVRAALRRLATRGLDVRVPLMTDGNGKPVYATRGRVPRYRLPCFPPPAGCACPSCRSEGVITVVTAPRHHSDALTVQRPSYAHAREASGPLPGSLVQKELARRVAAAGSRAGSDGKLISAHSFVAGESYRDYLGRDVADCAACGMPERHRAHGRQR